MEADATGVPMVTEALAGRKGKQPDGSAKTREVKLGCVFTQTRTDPETGLPVRDWNSTTYVGGFESAAEFGLRLREEARRRGLGRAVQVVFLGDAAAWIWEVARVNFPRAILIVDLYHVLERLYQLCQNLYAGQPSWAQRMKEQWKDLLHQDRVWGGKIVLCDALHTQVETSQRILYEKGRDYLMTVKTKFNTKKFQQAFRTARGGRERLQALIFAKRPAVLELGI